MKLNNIIEILKPQFKNGILPGYSAQNDMSSVGRQKRVQADFGTKPHKKSAVLILLYEKNGIVHFPLIQRHEYKGVHSGQVSFPGGKLEKSDIDLCQTALRETHEEVGINAKDVKVIGTLTDLYIPPSNHHVHPFVGYINGDANFVREEYEVEEILETELSSLFNDSIISETKVTIGNGIKIKTPYFDLHKKVVWGATAMILNEFRQMLLSK